MRRKAALFLCAGVIFSAILSNSVFADIYMKQKQHSDAMSIMGHTQPAQDMIVESWITPEKMVIINPKHKIVLDMVKKEVTIADNEKKTITTMPLDFSKMMDKETEKMSAEEKAELQKFMGGMMQLKVNVEPTNETKKIGDWNARKYIETIEMGMGNIRSEIWATPDIKIDKDLYAKFSAGMMAQIPGVSQNMGTLMKEIKKIDGVQVLTTQTTQMMGQSMNSSTELLEYKEGTAPADAFKLPTRYKNTNPFR